MPFDDHPGDVEPFAITLVPNPACELGYGIYAIRTWSHGKRNGDGFFASRCRYGSAVDPTGRQDVVLAAENKHGNYLDLDTCDAGYIWLDHCGLDFTLGDVNAWVGFNAGERHAQRHNDGNSFVPGVDLPAGEGLAWQVQAVGACGAGPYSTPVDFRIVAGEPIVAGPFIGRRHDRTSLAGLYPSGPYDKPVVI